MGIIAQMNIGGDILTNCAEMKWEFFQVFIAILEFEGHQQEFLGLYYNISCQ